MTALDQQIVEREAEGFVIAQEGRITRPPEDRVAFSDRAEGFDISLLGYAGGTVSRFENALLDDERRWVHLRKKRP